MKLIKTIFLFVAIISKAYSQQSDIAHFISQPLEINPAYAGSYNQYRGDIYYQTQNIGMEGSPVIFKINGSLPLNKLNSGLGIMYCAETNGNLNTNEVGLNYSYILDFEKINLHFGGGIDYSKTKIDFSSLTFPEDEIDPFYYYDENLNQLKGSLGLFLYTNEFYTSISYKQINLYSSDEVMNYNPYLNFIAGYHFFKFKKVSLCPSLLLKLYSINDPFLELNLTTVFSGKFWISSNYNKDYIKLKVGIDIWKCHGSIAYNYDFNSFKEEVRSISYATYEISTGFYFEKIKK